MNNEQDNLVETAQSDVPLPPPPPPASIPATNPAESTNKTAFIIGVSIVCGMAILAFAYVYVETMRQRSIQEMNELEWMMYMDDMEILEEMEPPYPDGPGIYSEEEWTEEPIMDIDYDEDWSEVDPSEREFIHTLADDPAHYSIYYKELITQDGVEWKDHPFPVGDLGLFSISKKDSQLRNKKFQYYEIATLRNKPIFVTYVPYCEMGCSNSLLYFIREADTEDAQYTYLEAQSTNVLTENDPYFGFELADNVTVDENFTLSAHTIPEVITIDGVEFTAHLGFGTFQWGPSFFADSYFNVAEREDGEMVEFVAETPYGPAFRGYRNMGDGNTKDLDYAVRLPGGLMISLYYRPDFIWDDRVPRIGWLDGTDNQAAYRTDGLGSCGGGGPEVLLNKIPDEDLLLAGYTINNEPIYKVINPTQFVLERLFVNGDTRPYYEYNPVTQVTEQKNISLNDFIDQGGVLIYVDPFGLQHVLTNAKYGPQAECAKPVIYLYPEETTEVSLSLDALVTKSEPTYEDGWVATAEPDGTLVVEGQTYDSLFWDGYGNGEYPEINQGYMVKTRDAIGLIEEQMKYMNFSDKEIADFVEFWAPHMPTEPYTRFSWLLTSDMERLAKLSIEPKPDTLIRVFLDYEGLNEPVVIETQKLPRIEREGFVVTEWGGLLRR